jgi:hypothetical protein
VNPLKKKNNSSWWSSSWVVVLLLFVGALASTRTDFARKSRSEETTTSETQVPPRNLAELLSSGPTEIGLMNLLCVEGLRGSEQVDVNEYVGRLCADTAGTSRFAIHMGLLRCGSWAVDQSGSGWGTGRPKPLQLCWQRLDWAVRPIWVGISNAAMATSHRRSRSVRCRVSTARVWSTATWLALHSAREVGRNIYEYECTDCNGKKWEETKNQYWTNPIGPIPGKGTKTPPNPIQL